MKFLIDTQLPKILAIRLQEFGFEAIHVLDLGLEKRPDGEIWQYAEDGGLVILTKDEDFALWIAAGKRGPSVVWLRIGNCRNSELISWLLPALPRILQALQQGDRLVEVR